MKFLYVFLILVNSCTGDRPNVVIIVADDLGWNDVGFHGSNQIPTPNIDALAYSGIILQNYYTLPLCTPSRAALLTGIHPIHTGTYDWVIWAPAPWGLPLDVKLLPQYLKDDGYKTHAIGKWHLGYCISEYTPQKRGFDTHFGYYTEKEDYFLHINSEPVVLDNSSYIPIFFGLDFRRGMQPTLHYQGKYATDVFTDEAVDIIDSHDTSSPLFLYLAHLAVHSANGYQPLQAPFEEINKFNYIEDLNRRVFAAMVKKLDDSVGRVVAALAAKNMLDNTIIIFTTDNGGPANGFNQNIASNWPLRGVKDTLWEGGVHGNGFIWSKNLPPSKVSHSLMHIQDWVPTILAAVNSSSYYNGSLNLDGHNMWPVLKGEKDSEYDELLLNKDPLRSISALRKGDWKVVQGHTYNGEWDSWYGPSGRTDDLHYDVILVENSTVAISFKSRDIPFPSADEIISLRENATVTCPQYNIDETLPCDIMDTACLFNVRLDPCEFNNLAQKEPDILNELIILSNKYVPVVAGNKPADPMANPKYWNYTWTYWKDYE